MVVAWAMGLNSKWKMLNDLEAWLTGRKVLRKKWSLVFCAEEQWRGRWVEKCTLDFSGWRLLLRTDSLNSNRLLFRNRKWCHRQIRTIVFNLYLFFQKSNMKMTKLWWKTFLLSLQWIFFSLIYPKCQLQYYAYF